MVNSLAGHLSFDSNSHGCGALEELGDGDTWSAGILSIEVGEDLGLHVVVDGVGALGGNTSGGGIGGDLGHEVNELGLVEDAVLVDVGGTEGSGKLSHLLGLLSLISPSLALSLKLGLVLVRESGHPGESHSGNSIQVFHRVNFLFKEINNKLLISLTYLVCQIKSYLSDSCN